MASDMPISSDGHPSPDATPVVPAPPWLRIGRALVGLALLALAWGAIMLAFLLASYTLNAPPHREIALRIAFLAAGVIGALWLGVVALGAVIVGAFCFMLALTTRHW
jgi:hypothetical protein